MLVFDTICGATKERQSDLVSLVEQGAEAIVVIGGRHSANTKKLAKLAAANERPTFHVETAEDLDAESFSSFALVGDGGSINPRIHHSLGLRAARIFEHSIHDD